jgi:predicted tellurium resistance membrane protein TerC
MVVKFIKWHSYILKAGIIITDKKEKQFIAFCISLIYTRFNFLLLYKKSVNNYYKAIKKKEENEKKKKNEKEQKKKMVPNSVTDSHITFFFYLVLRHRAVLQLSILFFENKKTVISFPFSPYKKI